MDPEQFQKIQSRRKFFRECAGGIGTVALAQLLAREGRGATPEVNPLAPRKPHFPPKAKNVIFMFMEGGPSQMDLFDPKPELQKWSGKPLPETTGRPKSQFTSGAELLLPSTRKWAKHGQSGIEISDLMPNLAKRADDI